MLKVAAPRPSSDAVYRSGERAPWRAPLDEDDEPPVRPLTRSEAQDMLRRQPAVSPWLVVLAQVGTGVVVAGLLWLLAGDRVAASALYGAAVVVVPGAMMARVATRRMAVDAPLASAARMLGWELVKMAVSVIMLAVAPRIVVGLNWPAMLATLGVCLLSYWFALLWRGRAQ